MDGIGSTYERMRGRPFAQFRDKLSMVRATSRFGINFVVNSETLAELPEAAAFAFDSGAEDLLLLPETAPDGSINLSPDQLEELSYWVNANYSRCRLATSAHGGVSIDAPILMSADPSNESFDFMHVDAFGDLKISAFAKAGIRLQDRGSIIESICRLRRDVGITRETNQ